MSDINEQIIDCLSEPEIKQFPDFCAAVRGIVAENVRLRETLEKIAENQELSTGSCLASALEESDRYRDMLKKVIRFGWSANIETNPEARMLGGKKPSTVDVWTFPKHMLTELESLIAEEKR